MFKPTFESLKQHACPDWFRDAKFGIWSHWGPQSVPMFGDWYARNMYLQGSEQNLYHVRHFGHPSEFGWKDVCALWKAEKFDPDELMDLYYKAGARYFVAQAVHHDNFFNYDSRVNRFNSVNIGPGKDICGLWKQAAKKYDMPFGLTEHLGASFSWWKGNKGADSYGPYKGIPYDGHDPEYREFYYDNYEHVNSNPAALGPWYTSNKKHHKYYLDAVKEMIDLYEPELLYTDGVLPFGVNPAMWEEEKPFREMTEEGDPSYQTGLEMVAYYYNKSVEVHGENQAVYLQKDQRPEIYQVGILDVEKSQLPAVNDRPWHTDTCIGNWFYDVKQPYKRADQIIEMLVDIIAKNGTMLLNILQRPDGTIDAETRFVLEELAKWFEACGEGVYGTRPWKQWQEGDTRVKINHFDEEKTEWNSSDYRFTCKGDAVYAFILCAPESRVAVLKSFIGEKVQSMQLLGYGEVAFTQSFGILTVNLPDELPAMCANCLKIII